MVHVPAKFRESTTAMRFRATVQKLNVTDGQKDRRTGAFQYLPSRAFGAAGDNKTPRDARAHRRHHGRLFTHQTYAFEGNPGGNPGNPHWCWCGRSNSCFYQHLHVHHTTMLV